MFVAFERRRILVLRWVRHVEYYIWQLICGVAFICSTVRSGQFPLQIATDDVATTTSRGFVLQRVWWTTTDYLQDCKLEYSGSCWKTLLSLQSCCLEHALLEYAEGPQT